MKVMEQICHMGHEQVVFAMTLAGLKAIIAIHSTALGPRLAVSECGIIDGRGRTSRCASPFTRMTYKNAAMELGLGGKAVIFGDSRLDKSPGCSGLW